MCLLDLNLIVFLCEYCYYSHHPEVKWAEREDKVYLTVLLPDAKDANVKLDPEGVFDFSAKAGPENQLYELKLELNDKVNVEVRLTKPAL